MANKDEWGGVEVAEPEQDEFGGVAIDGADEFGGIPIDEPQAESVRANDATAGVLKDYLRGTRNISPFRTQDELRPNRGVSPEVGGIAGANVPQPYGAAREILSDPFSAGTLPLTIAGRALNAAASDVGATIGTTLAGSPELAGSQGGNLTEFFRDPLAQSPQSKVLADISRSNPITATAGKVAGGIIESAPMLAVMPQGAIGKLVAAGFTVDMLSHAPDAARRLGAEMGKPEAERDMDAVTSALAELAQTAAFAPLTGAHAGGKVIGERIAPKSEVIRELAAELKKEPASPDRGRAAPTRELALRLDQGENVLGRPDIAQLADRALQEGPNPVLDRGDVSALERIRQELNPPEIQGVEPTRVAERIEGGGEAPYGRTSFQRTAEAPTTPRTQEARASEGSLKLGEVKPPEPGSTSAEQLMEMPTEQANKFFDDIRASGNATQNDAVLHGMKLGEQDVPRLQEMEKGLRKQAQKAVQSGDSAGFKAAYGKMVWLNGAIEGALRKGPNFDTLQKRQALRVNTNEIKQSIPLKDTAAEVTKLEVEFPGAPKINIAPDFTAMPKGAQDLAYSIGSNPRLIEAYVSRNGEVWINAEAARSAADVRRLAIHEWGHWAVNGKLGKSLNRFMDQAYETWKDSETMRSVKERYPEANANTLGREFVARLSENPMLAPKVWNRIVAQFRQWLRDAGFVKKVTENDIQSLITGAIDGMRKAERGEANNEGMLSLKSAADAAGERYPNEEGADISNAGENNKKTSSAKTAKVSTPQVGSAQGQAGAGKTSAPNTKPAVEISDGPERMRQSAARATTSEQVPEPVQERIAEAPESFYKSQKYKSVEEAVAAAGDAELAAVPKDSNYHVASQLELSRRLFEQGKLDEGYEVFKNVSRQGTEWGQNINQFKMLKGTTPANIIDLVNQGLKEAGRDPLTKKQMGDLAKTADESIQANRDLETAKTDWQKDPTDANAKKAQDALDVANKRDLETQREMNRFKIKTWPQMLKTFAQGNPLTPISHVSNFVGNTLGAAMEGSSRSIGTMLDVVRASLRDNERKLSVSPKNAVEAMKGFGEGLSKAPGILSKGSGDAIKGESRAGLQPLRALAKAFAKNPDVPTVGGKVPMNERIRLAVEGTFGIAPETMLRLLSAADKPAYEAARARLISEQAKLKGISSKDLPMARKFPELFFDKETLKLIKEESADAIFQRPSKAVSTLQNWIRDAGGDWGDLAFTIMVSPYKLTPWNLVVRTLQYNPLIAAAKTGIEAAKGNSRAAEISAGRMVVGSILYGAGYFLYQNGLIGPSLEGRGESQKERLLAGEVLPPNHVNVSGLKRAIQGGDPKFKPGDETIDLTRGGGAAGAVLSSVANIGRKMETKPQTGGGELAASLVRDGVLEQANFTINQSFLKGVTGVLDAIQNGNLGPYVTGVENMLLNVGTPNTLTALSRATRETAPDMKPDTAGQEFGNVIRNRFGILGADDYLPAKRDLFGEPIPQTPEGRNAILYHLFDISKGKQVTDDPVKLEIYNLWRKTANSEVIPSIPAREITVKKETYPIPRDLYSRYAELVGKLRKERADELVKNPLYLKATDEEKITAFERAYRKGAEVAKDQFWKEHGGELEKKPMRAGFK